MLPKFKQGLNSASKTMRDFPWHDSYAYAMYLAQTYYYVMHSTRLLALAAGRMDYSDNSFHKRFLDHAAEEKGHEAMALKDLQNLGFHISDFPELSETRMFWETQYYKIQHNDPMSLMGYVLALESLACEQCPWIKTQLEKFHPHNCYTFIRVHGEEDPDHVEKAWQQISSLPVERLKWVEENFDQTIISFQFMLEGIKRRAAEKSLEKVAA